MHTSNVMSFFFFSLCRCAEGYKGQRCDTKDIPNSGSYLSYFCIFGTNNPDYPCQQVMIHSVQQPAIPSRFSHSCFIITHIDIFVLILLCKCIYCLSCFICVLHHRIIPQLYKILPSFHTTEYLPTTNQICSSPKKSM